MSKKFIIHLLIQHQVEWNIRNLAIKLQQQDESLAIFSKTYTTLQHLDLFLQRLYETFATCLLHIWNIWQIELQHLRKFGETGALRWRRIATRCRGAALPRSDAPRRPEPQNLSTAPFLRLENSTTGRRRRRAAGRVSHVGELEPSSSFDEEAASASHLLPRAPRTRVGESAISRGRERSLDPWWRCRRSRTRSIWWCCFATEGG
jgi:hypothetical protein